MIAPAPLTATLPLPSSTLFVMGADGGDMREVWKPAEGLLGIPTWMPDGQALLIAANRVELAGTNGRDFNIIRIDLASGERRWLLGDSLDPALSRDGSRLVFLKLSADGYTMSLMLAGPDGGDPRELIKAEAFQGLYAPRFSPDGQRIIFAGVGGPETDPQGNPKTAQAPALLDRLAGLFDPPAAQAHGIPWELWSINIDGGGLRRLTNFAEDLPMAAFAPDGSQIAVQAESGVYLMQPDGSRLRRIDPSGDRGGLDWLR
jgi:Tol biopolymer transport system component